jgi:hypothetical protein
MLGKYFKKHTKVEESRTTFYYIFAVEFFNMGIINMLTSQLIFAGFTEILLSIIGINEKKYPGFTSDWYMESGVIICLSIFMSPWISGTADLKKFGQKLALRFLDRRFKFNLKADPDDDYDDVPNTR